MKESKDMIRKGKWSRSYQNPHYEELPIAIPSLRSSDGCHFSYQPSSFADGASFSFMPSNHVERPGKDYLIFLESSNTRKQYSNAFMGEMIGVDMKRNDQKASTTLFPNETENWRRVKNLNEEMIEERNFKSQSSIEYPLSLEMNIGKESPIQHQRHSQLQSLGLCPIIRRPVIVSMPGTNLKMSNTQSTHFQSIDLRVCGCKITEIFQIPWNPREVSEGRRIMRVSKIQEGNVLRALFLTVQSSMSHGNAFKSEANDFLEISCIINTSQNSLVKFMITSVDTIRIIEFLLGNNGRSSKFKWKERGRIRSNLAPLWHKPNPIVSAQYGTEVDHLLWLQILKYKSHKPYSTLRKLRMMLWDDLEHAMQKAFLFYCIRYPESFAALQ